MLHCYRQVDDWVTTSDLNLAKASAPAPHVLAALLSTLACDSRKKRSVCTRSSTKFGAAISGMRMSATRQEMLFIRRDFKSSEALANVGSSRLRRCVRRAEPVGHPHKLGQRRRFHLPHDLPTVNLHRHLAEVELARDLLVRSPNDDERHDLALALGQRGVALLQLDGDPRPPAPVPVTLDRRVNRIEQVLLVERLGQELYRPGLHRPHAHRYIAVTADEDDRESDSRPRELILKRQTAHARQSHVQHETTQDVRRLGLQVLLRRGKE